MKRPRHSSCFRWLLVVAAVAATLFAADSPSRPIRFGYMRSLLRTANENDFRSAMRAYSRLLAGDSGFSVGNDHFIFDSTEAMIKALRAGEVDIVGGAAAEVLSLPEGLVEPPFLSATVGTVPGATYVLLVSGEGEVRSLADLKGRRIALLDNTHGSLVRPWLEQILREASLPPAASFLHEIKPVTKATLAALPVFFGQSDACIVTAASFATLCELNPQLSRKLRPIATSPRFVPILSGFSSRLDSKLRESLSRSIAQIDQTPTGRQLLTLFQTDALQFCTEDVVAATRKLVGSQQSPSATAPAPP